MHNQHRSLCSTYLSCITSGCRFISVNEASEGTLSNLMRRGSLKWTSGEIKLELLSEVECSGEVDLIDYVASRGCPSLDQRRSGLHTCLGQ
jgi:hypothetical protein